MEINNEEDLMIIIEKYQEGRNFLINTIKKQENLIKKQQEFIKDIENNLLKLKNMVIKLKKLK